MGYEIISDMTNRAEQLRAEVRAAKTAQGKSNQALAEETGIGKSSVDKLLAGNIGNPGLIQVAAICKVLGLSIDGSMGLNGQTEGAELEELRRKAGQLEEQNRLLMEGIAYRNQTITETRNAWKRLCYGLCGLAIAAFGLLLGVLAVYLVSDYRTPEQGFIRGGVVPVWMLAAAAGIVCIALYVAHWAAKRRTERKNAPTE